MKFAVGEIALHIGGHGFAVGESIQIAQVGPFKCGNQIESPNTGKKYTIGEDVQYIIISLDQKNSIAGADDNELRKLPGDSIPASTLALFTKKQPNPDKVKETIP